MRISTLTFMKKRAIRVNLPASLERLMEREREQDNPCRVLAGAH